MSRKEIGKLGEKLTKIGVEGKVGDEMWQGARLGPRWRTLMELESDGWRINPSEESSNIELESGEILGMHEDGSRYVFKTRESGLTGDPLYQFVRVLV